MIILASFLIGALWGDLRARRMRGNTKDRVQYALAHGLGLAILGLFVTVFVDRAMMP